MRALFSQCTCVRAYVHTYICVRHTQECQFALTVCTHASRALTIEVEDKEERCFLTMEDAVDSAAGPPQRTCFAESSAERSQRLATLRKRKQQSQCTKKAKKARREPDKVQTKKHIVESLHKPDIHFQVQFNHSPS